MGFWFGRRGRLMWTAYLFEQIDEGTKISEALDYVFAKRDGEPFGSWTERVGDQYDIMAGINTWTYVLRPNAQRYPGYWWWRVRKWRIWRSLRWARFDLKCATWRLWQRWMCERRAG